MPWALEGRVRGIVTLDMACSHSLIVLASDAAISSVAVGVVILRQCNWSGWDS